MVWCLLVLATAAAAAAHGVGSLLSTNSSCSPGARTLEGHDASVYAVAADFDKELAVSGSGDKTLKVWGQYQLCLAPRGLQCPEGFRVTSREGCGPERVLREDLPLGCSWKAGSHPMGKGEGLVFNQGSTADVADDTHPQVCRDPQSCLHPEAAECKTAYICICPHGNPASEGCTHDGQLKCVIVSATLLEWLCALGIAITVSACLNLCSGGAQVSPVQEEQEVAPVDQDREHPPPDGARLLAREKWAREQGFHTTLLLFMLGRLNSQVVLISMMAWLCTQGIVPFAVGKHEIHIHAFMILVLLTSVATAFAFRPPGKSPSTALDFFVPRGMSLSGLVAVDGRTLAAVEVLRMLACSALVALALGVSLPGWPADVAAWAKSADNPDDMDISTVKAPGAQQLTVLRAAGLHGLHNAIVSCLFASGAFAVLHSLWTLHILLCSGSSAYALRLQSSPYMLLGPTLEERLEEDARQIAEACRRETEKNENRSWRDFWAARNWCGEVVLPVGEDQHAQTQVQLINGTQKDIIKFLSMTILPLACDFGSDLVSVWNYMAGGHIGFGTCMLCLFIYTAVKDWRKWLDFPGHVRSTLRLGYQTEGLWELRRGEVEDEALLSLLINLYGLPWAIHDNKSLAMQLFFVGLSLKGVVERLVQRDMGL